MTIISYSLSLLSQTHTYLNDKEISTFKSFAAKEERAAEWLMGRIAAKTAVREFYRSQKKPVPAWKDITVAYRTNGQPYIHILNTNPASALPLSLSLSHTTGYAAAEVEAKENTIGIDIESIRNFGDEFSSNFLTSREQKEAQAFSLPLQNVYKTILWSLKESYLKAQGCGLRKHPSKIETLFDPFSNTFSIFENSKQNGTGWFKRIGEKNLISKVII